jgi:hypothetical protein
MATPSRVRGLLLTVSAGAAAVKPEFFDKNGVKPESEDLGPEYDLLYSLEI